MKENIFDVLMYLFENYMDEDMEISPDSESLKVRLEEAGFPQHEVNMAFAWLEGLARQRESEATEALSKPTSIRIYTPVELKKLVTECRGFLLFLEQIEVLAPATREIIIERAMALEIDEIDLERIKWIILMVLFNQPGQEASFAWIENIVFEEMDYFIH